MDSKIGKRAFKLFKTNMFSVTEVAQMLNVDEKTLENEFRSFCGDQFVYPGVYLVGGWVDKIVEWIDKTEKVLIIGEPGTGKSVNAMEAAKKISSNVGKPRSLEAFEKMINARHPGVILVDDIDMMGNKHKSLLEYAAGVKGVRIIATSTKDFTVNGFYTLRIKSPQANEMEELARVKGWKMIKGARNLTDMVKANVYGGGIATVTQELALAKVRDVLGGKQIEDADKLVIEQVIRNGYEMDRSPERIENLAKSCMGAWLSMMNGTDPSPSLSSIRKTSGAAALMFRKSVFDG
jgi:transcriptional regulator with PAS, ATPase and Fis domain